MCTPFSHSLPFVMSLRPIPKQRTFIRRFTRRMVHKDWYNMFKKLDYCEAWNLLRRQIQFQCFRNEFIMIPHFENRSQYQLWDVFLFKKVNLLNKMEPYSPPPVVLPIGFLHEYGIVRLEPKRRKDYFGFKSGLVTETCYSSCDYKACVSEGTNYWKAKKEILIHFSGGIYHRSVPIVAPKEFIVSLHVENCGVYLIF